MLLFWPLYVSEKAVSTRVVSQGQMNGKMHMTARKVSPFYLCLTIDLPVEACLHSTLVRSHLLGSFITLLDNVIDDDELGKLWAHRKQCTRTANA